MGLVTPALFKNSPSKKYIFFFVLLLLKPLAALAMYAPSAPAFLIPVMFIAQMVLFTLYAPVKYTLMQNAIPNHFRATILSIQSQAIALAGLIFYGGSTIATRYLDINKIIPAALFLTFIALIFICRILKRLLISCPPFDYAHE